MSKLIIVESPAKCKKIEGFLGSGYKCIASFGHIRELKNGLKSIDMKNNYKFDFRLIPGKSKYISNLRTQIKRAKEVILATDDDREGEAIAWHICMSFKLPVETTKRMIFHEITKKAILESINNLTVVNMKKVNAQLARQALDVIVGYNMCPLLWKHISSGGPSKQSLSAGRCQTPALRIVYEQEEEINNTKPKMVYETTGTFITNDTDFKLTKNIDNIEDMEKFLKESKGFEHIYTRSDPRIVIKKPPLPLSTSVLQQKSSNELGYSPKQTMRIAQNLYEAGLITYMRTDNKKYSKEFIKSAKSLILKKYGEEYVNNKIHYLAIKGDETNNSKDTNKPKTTDKSTNKKEKKPIKGKKSKGKKDLAQEAHEAIRPTKINTLSITMSKKITNKEKRLYELIWKTTMKSCMSDAKYNQIKAKIEAPLKCKYTRNEEEVVFPGWKIIDKVEMKNAKYRILKDVCASDEEAELEYYKIQSRIILTNTKTHYTEARLIQLLEKKGIGRPSTFSSIISKIQDRGYVNKEDIPGRNIEVVDYELDADKDNEIVKHKSERTFGNERNKLKLQTLGKIVLEFLLSKFDNIFVYDYTKNMEEKLDEIENGEETKWYSICDECNNDIQSKASKIEKKERVSYKIDENHTYMIAKYGPVIKYVKDGKSTFKKVKKNIDLDKLKKGEYSLEDILLESANNSLGKYKDQDVVVKKGKYGLYATHAGSNYTLKYVKKSEEDITLEDVITVIENKGKRESNILKQINEHASVRKGKYGEYVFYKTKTMTKPIFLKMKKGLDWNTIDEDWLEKEINKKK